MKKILILSIFIISLLVFMGCSKEEGSLNNVESSSVLDMQGYELKVPKGYSCTGGFTDGYRYLDANCNPNKGNHKIIVEAGLGVLGIDPSKGLVDNQLVVRSYEFTKQYDLMICEEYFSEDLNLDSENYLCLYEKDGKRMFTLGIGKSRSSHGWWFESHLIADLDDETPNEDYIEELTKFLNSAVKIDWENFE